ncbi:zinc finger protein ZFP2 isoform X2 [Anabrus simplex]
MNLLNQEAGDSGDSISFQVKVEEMTPSSRTALRCHKMCRLCACLVSEEKLTSLFSTEAAEQNLVDKINRLLPDKVQEDDGLPHHVCSSCIDKLNDCNVTVEAFIAADKKLRNLFENSPAAQQRPAYIKLEQNLQEVQGNKSYDPAELESTLTEFLTIKTDPPQENLRSVELEAVGEEEICSKDQEQVAFYPVDEVAETVVSAADDTDMSVKVYSCVICSESFESKNKLLIHEISEHACDRKSTDGTTVVRKYKRRQNYTCNECGNNYLGLKALKRHMREKHVPPENICEFCGAHYLIKNQLEVHRRLHTDEKPFSCDVCSESFHFKKALRRHKRIHVEPKSLTCKICNKTFGSRSAMWRHERIHSKSHSVLCYLCGKVLSNSQSLRVHMKTHSTDRPCSCPTCGKTFKDNRSVVKHQLSHSTARNFRCDVCGRAFYSKALVKQHKLSHSGVKPHKCEACGAAFNRLGNLNQHKKKHGQSEELNLSRPQPTHECVVCGKWMRSELTLKYHLAKHTGEKKPFDCELCGKRFVAVDPYRVHMRIHTGERPYECNVCEKKFRSSFTLKQHSALHKDEYPYPCTYCERRFKRLQSLVVHKRTHTGEKPHKCPSCGRCFAQKGDMIKHTKTHDRGKTMVLDIADLVLSDTDITSEFLIDMPIVEVETHSDIQQAIVHPDIQHGIPCVIQTEM